MSEQPYLVNAETRTDKGKGASRRLRRANRVPAILYGGKEEPKSLSLDHDRLTKQLENEGFYSRILELKIDGSATEQVVLKDIQRHPFKVKVSHVDFQRVSAKEKLDMHIPLHFMGEEKAPGPRHGGIFSHEMTDVEVQCLPKDLPEYIEVDVSNMDVGDTIHLSDLKLPAGVESVALMQGPEHDLPVVSVHVTRGGAEAAEEGGEEGAEEGGEE